MLIPNHPHDERLSALASLDDDASADASLTEHVSSCVRCTDLVNELGALRVSLAELPDLVPHRPLRLLPEAADVASRPDRAGGWARRFFAPVLTAGAALAMVGLVGTAGPALNGMASSGAAAPEDAGQYQVQPSAGGEAAGEADGGSPATFGGGEPTEQAVRGVDNGGASPSADDVTESEPLTSAPAEPSPWPMLLFTGIALMVGAAMLRWILVPRAG